MHVIQKNPLITSISHPRTYSIRSVRPEMRGVRNRSRWLDSREGHPSPGTLGKTSRRKGRSKGGFDHIDLTQPQKLAGTCGENDPSQIDQV